MAKPRVFISSTYFDLKNVRADLERFIRTQGYEPVLNERGHIAYGNKEKLEEYCYKEIQISDILVSIVGGRFGSQSRSDSHSISNLELKTAIDLGKQVYIFIDRAVYNEFRTYERNKGNKEISYASVDDRRIFSFIEEIQSLPINNPISSFETSSEITEYLKEQWSGLFQRLLSENSKQKEIAALDEIRTTAKTLNQLVSFLVEERKNGDQAFKEILLSNHPAFNEIKSLINIPYRIFFSNINELDELLKARSFNPVDEENWDTKDYMEWLNSKISPGQLLKIHTSVFDEERKLKIIAPDQWSANLVLISDWSPTDDFDDDIPF
ncbi:DUF4062 domain-containing protein [Pseudomonas sp. JM0905a]|uniref:DUF4062 domain-containing protein n=1 Tax=Pseudomonas sp. JM0905a TaxID=2772484 RepID=UPI0016880A11|nr:DUF4062 domain-containing protein [Pseudomonas sp. JM0905a]MBD2839208.1 DUF4062 domain-containing protein [Pseudomonas sp. JM0905a]